MRAKKNGLKVLLLILALIWMWITWIGYNQSNSDSSSLKTITIGYQKADPVDVAKSRGVLVKKMKAKGYHVVFKEFKDGSSLIQALKSGNVDYARTGDVPPITAQSSGVNLTYVAASSSKAAGSGILVKKNANIDSISDLKGKKIAYTKNTSSEYLIMKVLKKAGLTTDDVTLVNMDQSSAGVSFAKGKIDAWTTWDPYTAQGELSAGGQLLIDGEGISNNRDFIISTTKFTSKNRKATNALIKYLGEDMDWANTHKTALVKMLSKSLNMSKKIIQKQVSRRTYSMAKMTKNIATEQQTVANFLTEENLMKGKIDVSSKIWK